MSCCSVFLGLASQAITCRHFVTLKIVGKEKEVRRAWRGSQFRYGSERATQILSFEKALVPPLQGITMRVVAPFQGFTWIDNRKPRADQPTVGARLG